MHKTELMKQFEEETDKQSAYPNLGPYDYNMEYLAWLEAKAEAYDRLMGGGRKTLNEWANIFGMAVAVDQDGEVACFVHVPVMYIDDGIWLNSPKHCGADMYLLPPHLIDFDGDWMDSLTFPDGWDE